jgi:hypothetical protein
VGSKAAEGHAVVLSDSRQEGRVLQVSWHLRGKATFPQALQLVLEFPGETVDTLLCPRSPPLC